MSKAKVTTRTGRYGPGASLPDNVREAFDADDPPWDWCQMGDGTNAWVVMRIYDEGREVERIAALVKTERFVE